MSVLLVAGRPARRRRAVTRTGGALALTLALGVAGWAVDTQPWHTPALVPAGRDVLRVAGEGDVTTTPTTELTADAAEPGWPDAAFSHSVGESDDGSGEVRRSEVWSGHTDPGLLVDGGDLATAAGIGPSSWGNLLIDHTWTLVSWHVLYSLPPDPIALEDDPGQRQARPWSRQR